MPALFTARAHRSHARIGEMYEIYEIYGSPCEMYGEVYVCSMKRQGGEVERIVEEHRMH